MAMSLALGLLPVASVRNGPAVNIPASSLNSSQFVTYSGISVEKRFSALSIAEPSPRQNHNSLVIEAREPTRREKVKTRHNRIRKKCNGTPERPRLCVFRSNKHIYVQVIDDTSMHTLASASTLLPGLREELQLTAGPTIVAATRVGEEVAKACLEKGISKVAFDRGGFLYHGRIKAVADGARSGGLDF